jgi:hypothetical protein
MLEGAGHLSARVKDASPRSQEQAYCPTRRLACSLRFGGLGQPLVQLVSSVVPVSILPSETSRCEDCHLPVQVNSTTNSPLPLEALKEIADFTLRICTPLYWHDRRTLFPKEVEGGSCFILRFSDRLVGVTAAHVLQAYHAARQQIPTLLCQLRSMPFELHNAIIDCDHDLDIATFELSDAELTKMDCTPVDCTGQWPPPPPIPRRFVSFAGFPQAMHVTRADRSATFGAYGALSVVEDASDRDILLTYDPARDQSFGGLPLPRLGWNLSGCSGGQYSCMGYEMDFTGGSPWG